MSFVLLLVGLIMLVKGADLVVDSSSKLARMYGVSSFVIGLSVVAFGTSAPEAAVGVISGIRHTNQIVLGTVIGSSIANIALIVGLTAIIMPISVDKSVLTKEIPISIATKLVLLALILIGGVISRVDGVILILLFAAFLYYIVLSTKKKEKIVETEKVDYKRPFHKTNKNQEFKVEAGIENPVDIKLKKVQRADGKTYTFPKAVETTKEKLKLGGLVVVGLIGLILGGDLVVSNGTKVAQMLGLSEALIGLTVIAVGTSLPELVTSILAAIRKESDIAIGNIIGSNIFNVLLVLGISSLIFPINLEPATVINIAVMIFSAVLLLAFSTYKRKVSRIEGIVLFLFYTGYIVFNYING